MSRCPICDQKRMNCDCTDNERRQYSEISDLEELSDFLHAEIERLRAENEKLRALCEIPPGMRVP